VHCLQPILEVLAHYLPPGTLTLILGVLAAVSALPKVAKTFGESSRKHAVAIFIFFSIAALEIAVIRYDRRMQDNKHESELAVEGQRFDKVFGLLQGVQGGQNVQISAANKLNQLLTENQHLQKTSEERQLKVRALDLSRDIAQFTTQVRMQEVALPTPATHGLASINDPAWANWQTQLETIEHNAAAQYHAQFGTSVKDVVEQLKKRGVLDKTDCDGPKDRPDHPAPSQVRFMYVLGCAQDLQLGASKLP